MLSANPPSNLNCNVVLKSALNDKNGLKICSFNARSIFKKLDEIKNLLDGVNVDLICVTETLLKEAITDSAISIDGFDVIRKDRVGNRGGGVCIYIKNNLNYKVVLSESNNNIETIFIEIILHKSKLLLGVVYKPPKKDGVGELEKILYDLSLLYSSIILCGDFNYNILRSSRYIRLFLNLLESYSLDIINTEPTYFYESGSSLLDLIITNTNKVSFWNQISVGCFDHDLMFFVYDSLYDSKFGTNVFRDFKNLNTVAMYQFASALPWSKIADYTHIDEKLDLFNDLTLNVLERCVPLRKVKKEKKFSPSWFNNAIVDAIILRDIAYSHWKKSRTNVCLKEFRRLRNIATDLVRKAKTKFINEKLNPKLPPAAFWKSVKNLGISESKKTTANNFSPNELNNYFAANGSGNRFPLISKHS